MAAKLPGSGPAADLRANRPGIGSGANLPANRPRLAELFGKEGLQIVSAGDPVATRSERDAFLAAYAAKHAIDTKDGQAVLSIGAGDWPFPIPLKQAASGWSFDAAAGREEILDRRIGGNELYVQQVVLAYVDAQTEYVQSLHGMGCTGRPIRASQPARSER